jgi:hypothetical protein
MQAMVNDHQDDINTVKDEAQNGKMAQLRSVPLRGTACGPRGEGVEQLRSSANSCRRSSFTHEVPD